MTSLRFILKISCKLNDAIDIDMFDKNVPHDEPLEALVIGKGSNYSKSNWL